ncbi:MAG: NmrA family transcriptional regulator [Paenibacillaceae bacterium]|jgi:NAD(P)H dehydrogenase (quinone)|nr:NmrA family transcriptional regulator [Paenibacillaceae bacterium]
MGKRGIAVPYLTDEGKEQSMKILVTGATGGLGGTAIQSLLDTYEVPAEQVVALARDPGKLSGRIPAEIEVRQGDYSDPGSLAKAFTAIDRLLFIPGPDRDNTLRVLQNANVVKAARDAGIKHIIYTGFAFAEKSTSPVAAVHLATEYMIRTTGIPYTFLRNSFYGDLFVSPVLKQSVERGAIVTNSGNGRVNTVFRRDLARAAAAVLAGEGHENQSYNLVLSEPWTFDELAMTASEISGKKVAHVSVSFEEQKAMLVNAGMPESLALVFAGIYASVANGETADASDDLNRLIGEPTPLKELVRQTLQG